MSTKDERRAQHERINSLSNYTVAKIVKAHFPKLSASRVNQMAKIVVGAAHELISPKKV
jgi:ribosomal protein L11